MAFNDIGDISDSTDVMAIQKLLKYGTKQLLHARSSKL